MYFQKFYKRQLNGSRVRTDITLLLLWQLWKARNATIFNKENSSPSDIFRRVAKDLESWSCRYGRRSADVDLWKNWIRMKL